MQLISRAKPGNPASIYIYKTESSLYVCLCVSVCLSVHPSLFFSTQHRTVTNFATPVWTDLEMIRTYKNCPPHPITGKILGDKNSKVREISVTIQTPKPMIFFKPN